MKLALAALCLAALAVAQDQPAKTASTQAGKDTRQTIAVMTSRGTATVKADRILQSRDGRSVFLRGNAYIALIEKRSVPSGSIVKPTVIQANEADIRLDTGDIVTR